ncbi:Chromosome partition protein Smc [Carpediemonas membranifera]|uniref:Chromosome partition protein Smc n=1 Tax=Carpediemonas membranifera TaxID=201153 RepID=A0A8J6B167_9EUKA|nr:Chromosome partition protein Smc [Carpediemonas membranifera]|eukprot:KAG9390827.1 Chromosome partition protein Smc [Carpediemonas membranifera]
MSEDKAPELSIETRAIEQLEKDFNNVIAELVGDDSLEHFRKEYEKMHRALKKSHENEKRLISRIKTLGGEIASNASKVKSALKISQDDWNAISSLKKEIEQAYSMLDASREKEARSRETVQHLKAEIANLTKLVEQGAGINLGQENTVAELMKQKDELIQQRDSKVKQIMELRQELSNYLERVRELEDEKVPLEAQIKTLKDLVTRQEQELKSEQWRKEVLDKDMADLRKRLELRQEEIEEKKDTIRSNADAAHSMKMELQRLENDIHSREVELKGKEDTVHEFHVQVNQLNERNSTLEAELAARENELKEKDQQIRLAKQETSRVNKELATTKLLIQRAEKDKADLEKRREALRSDVVGLERDLKMTTRDADKQKQQADVLARERELLNKNVRQADAATSKQAELVKIAENQAANLDQEISAYKNEAQKQRKMIFVLEQERELNNKKATEANQKYLQALEEVKVRENTIQDLQKKIAEAEKKLKQQQTLYEAVRADRNLYSKNLIESQDEVSEMKRKFKIMNHQIEQLKEEIKAKDSALVQEYYERKKAEKERDSFKAEIGRIQRQIQEAEQTIAAQKAEMAKLNLIINEADNERGRQQKEFEQVISERDILGTQLIRRNDELALLYEKIKIQQSTLAKGEAQYRERVEDIRLLKIKLASVMRELNVYSKAANQIDGYKTEVIRIQKELLEERAKVKAMSEELQNPMNVHRWRKLEGSDPAVYEMIQKIHTLQKRLLKKTEEVAEKELIIDEREKAFTELQKLLARQPGPEVVEQLSIYQTNLREKNKQLKSMASELTMYQTQVAEYKYEIAKLTKESHDIKKKYFEQKRKEQSAARRTMDEGYVVQQDPAQPKFVGGGFKLETTVRSKEVEL